MCLCRAMLVFLVPRWLPMGALLKKNRCEKAKKYVFPWIFDVFLPFSIVFGPFLTSWRPGKPLESSLEVVRLFWTEYEPVGTHGDPNRMRSCAIGTSPWIQA